VCRALRRLPDRERAAFWQKRVQREPVLESVRRHPLVVRLVAGVL
jgi:hypothetical protein